MVLFIQKQTNISLYIYCCSLGVLQIESGCSARTHRKSFTAWGPLCCDYANHCSRLLRPPTGYTFQIRYPIVRQFTGFICHTLSVQRSTNNIQLVNCTIKYRYLSQNFSRVILYIACSLHSLSFLLLKYESRENPKLYMCL